MSEQHTAPFSALDHHDMLGNFLQYCSLPQVILSIMPVCKRWFAIALQFDNYHFHKRFFATEHNRKKFKDYCKSLTSQFTTSLDFHGPTEDDIEALISSNSFKKLKELGLTHSESDIESTCKLLKMVASCEISKNIQILDLHRFRTDDEGLSIIAQSDNFNRLIDLKTYWNGFTVEGIKLLASHPKFSQLKSIQLTDLCGDEGFEVICQSPNFSNLTCLDIGQGNISNEGMKYFASSPYLKKVKEFIADRCEFDGEGMRILCESDNSLNIKKLVLVYTVIGDEGVKYIAQSPNMKNLEYLDISCTDTGNESVKYIVESPYLKKLKKIGYINCDPYYELNVIDGEGGDLLKKFLKSLQLK